MKELKVKLFKQKLNIIIEYPIQYLSWEGKRERFFYNRSKNSQLTHTHTHTHSSASARLGLVEVDKE